MIVYRFNSDKQQNSHIATDSCIKRLTPYHTTFGADIPSLGGYNLDRSNCASYNLLIISIVKVITWTGRPVQDITSIFLN